MAATVLQTAGYVVSVLGVVALLAATAMNNWSTEDRQGDVVTSVYTYKGLWRNCEVATSALPNVDPTTVSLDTQAVRALMVVSVVMGAISALIGLFSLKCFRVGSMEDSPRAKMTLTTGIMFLVSGLCGIAGASIYANQIVASFMRTMYNNNYGQGMMGGMGGMEGGIGVT